MSKNSIYYCFGCSWQQLAKVTIKIVGAELTDPRIADQKPKDQPTG